MFKIATYKRFENESDDELIYRICKDKEQIGTWEDVKNILNNLTGADFGESTYRKRYQCFCKMFNANQKTFASSGDTLLEISDQIRELKKERYKLQTEKLENNKWLRENARDELIGEQITDAISQLTPLDIPDYIEPVSNDKSYLLAFSDCHYGIEIDIKDIYGNTINKYSPEIFERRMWQMLNKLIDRIYKDEITELNVWELGDSVNGLLRLNSQLMHTKYGVMDSAIKYANFLATWLCELSHYVRVKFQMVMDSNHNQLRLCGAPKNSFSEENVSKVIVEILKARLLENKNISIIENVTGNNYGLFSTYSVLGIHGEVKNINNCLNELSRAYGTQFDYCIMGHCHHANVKENGQNSETITVRSMVGVDNYGMSLNKVSDVGASLLTFEQGYGKISDIALKVD